MCLAVQAHTHRYIHTGTHTRLPMQFLEGEIDPYLWVSVVIETKVPGLCRFDTLTPSAAMMTGCRMTFFLGSTSWPDTNRLILQHLGISCNRTSLLQENVSQFFQTQFQSIFGNLPILRSSSHGLSNFHTSEAGSFKPQICATFCGSHSSMKFALGHPKS